MAQPLHAQDSVWQKLGEAKLLDWPVSLSADGLNRVIVAYSTGDMACYDTLGQLRHRFAELQRGEAAQLDAQSALRIFAFYPTQAKAFWVDRFLSRKEAIPLPESYQEGALGLLAPASDGHLWQLDPVQFLLRKSHLLSGQILSETALNFSKTESFPPDPFGLQEHQGNLYLLADGGAWAFSLMGEFRKAIVAPEIHPTAKLQGIAGEWVYFTEKNNLIFRHLYTEQVHSVALPASADALRLSVGGQYAFLIKGKQLIIFRLKQRPF